VPGGGLKGIAARIVVALRTWPDRAGWARLGLEAAWLVPVLLALGFAGGLMSWAPRFDAEIARLAAVALVAPALGEELLFRAAVLPRPRPGPLPWAATILSTLLFVLWHPPQAWLFGPHWGETVLDPWFLLCVAALGVASARLYWRTGSIWPSVLLHWTVVVAWKALLDGPSPWVAA
jgi:predicted Abi (CAAX) family protease